MNASLVKFFTLSICSVLLHTKLLNYTKLTMLKKMYIIIFSCGMTAILFLIQSYPNYLKIICLPVLLGSFMCLLTEIRLDIALTTSTISAALSYVLGFITFSISVTALHLFFSHLYMLAAAILSLSMNFLIIFLIFKIKRLQKGLQFLKDSKAGGIGIAISGLILMCLAIAGIKSISDIVVGALCFGATISFIGFFLWWRNSLTKKYIENLQERELNNMKTELSKKDIEIATLTENNNSLASIIHRDNKLVPSLAVSVMQFMSLYHNNDTVQSEGARLLENLSNIMRERSDLIVSTQRKHKKLPSTSLSLIDSTFEFFNLKATEHGIDFDLLITGNVKHMAETAIPISKLQTIIADHVEDAIIATKDCEQKKMFVTIGVCSGCYELSIKDSGVAFKTETLLNLGKEKTTTRASEGGSGIGFMTTFDILKEFSGSLIIEEYCKNPLGFSKAVIIRFDGKNEYIVRSHRAETMRNMLSQHPRDDIILITS